MAFPRYSFNLYIMAITFQSQQAVRLVGGPSEFEGRVEIFRKDIWGTVCDDRWDDNDAAVVCRQLDLSDRGTAVNKAEYGRGVGAIMVDEAGCIGTEEYLDECTKGEWKKHDCTHQEDAGVKCQGTLRHEPYSPTFVKCQQRCGSFPQTRYLSSELSLNEFVTVQNISWYIQLCCKLM